MRKASRAITRIDALRHSLSPFSIPFFSLCYSLFLGANRCAVTLGLFCASSRSVSRSYARQIKLQLTPKRFPFAWDTLRANMYTHPQFSRVITKVSHRRRRIRHSRSRADERICHNLCDTTQHSGILITKNMHVRETHHEM